MADETETTTNDQMVPKERLDALIVQRDEARARVAILEGQTQDMQGKVDSYKALSEQSEAYKTEAEKAKASLETSEQGWGRQKVMLRGGVHDEDVQELLGIKFGKDEGTDFGTFFEAEKVKPYVQAVVQGAATTTTTATTTEAAVEGGAEVAATTKPAVSIDAGNPATPLPGAIDFTDPAAIRDMSPADFAKHAPEITKATWGGK